MTDRTEVPGERGGEEEGRRGGGGGRRRRRREGERETREEKKEAGVSNGCLRGGCWRKHTPNEDAVLTAPSAAKRAAQRRKTLSDSSLGVVRAYRVHASRRDVHLHPQGRVIPENGDDPPNLVGNPPDPPLDTK